MILYHLEGTVVVLGAFQKEEQGRIFLWYLADSGEVNLTREEIGADVQIDIPVPVTQEGLIYLPSDESYCMIGGMVLHMN